MISPPANGATSHRRKSRGHDTMTHHSGFRLSQTALLSDESTALLRHAICSCAGNHARLLFFHLMHLIQRMLAETSQLPPEKQVVLPAERRQFLKRRWRATAEDGTEFGFDLEARLIDGCVIFHGNGLDYLVRQLPETVYRIPFRKPRPRRARRMENRQPPPSRPDSRGRHPRAPR